MRGRDRPRLQRPCDLALTALAALDVATILAHTVESFGVPARRRYEALIETAIEELRHDPLLIGSRDRSELGLGVRTYHLRHSQTRARTKEGGVREPRHMLVYENPSADLLVILRVLHDAMDLPRHLPRTGGKKDVEG